MCPKRIRQPGHVSEYSFSAIGTEWSITAPDGLDRQLLSELINFADDFDHYYSRFKSDSWFRMSASKPGTYILRSDARPLLDFYETIYELTGGAVTPLIGQTLSDMGYDESYSLKPKNNITAPPPLRHIYEYDYPELAIHQDTIFDFGAAGKGYLADLLAAKISMHVSEYMVDASGDIVVSGAKPVRIGLEHPKDPSLVIGVAEIKEGALCGSAINRRAWRGYHHVVNGLSGENDSEVVATWVYAVDGLTADGLATALFFTSPETLCTQFSFEYVIIESNGRVIVSSNFPGGIFS